MSLHIIPYNNAKRLESMLINMYVNVDKCMCNFIKINSENISGNQINKLIVKAFDDKPDLIAISINNNHSPIIFKNLPRFPVFSNNTFYLTPLMIYNLDGFDSTITNMTELINDTINRIIERYGCIISHSGYKFPAKSNPKKFGLNRLISSTNNIFENRFIAHVPQWMSNHVIESNVGWFARYNKNCIDYLFENCDISNIVELGVYNGTSSKYIATLKKPKSHMFCVDVFTNIMNTQYVADSISPIDTKYFFKYDRYESFHKKIAGFSNVYSVTYDCNLFPSLIKKYDISVDLFYIDFIKNNNVLVKFINMIFNLYPNCIIMGDDLVYLSKAIKILKQTYKIFEFKSCYLISKNTKLRNIDKLLKEHNQLTKYEEETDINKLAKLDIQYRFKYLIKMIDNKNSQTASIINKLNVNPNTPSHYVFQYGNLYHHISLKYHGDKQYYFNLYNELFDIYGDDNITNNFNLTPNDYFNYKEALSFM
jgi:hypothetical protein